MRRDATPTGANGTLVIRGGRPVTAAGIGEPVDIVVLDGAVAGPTVPVPPDAVVLDAAGAYVSAGWIDPHTHVFGDIGIADPDTAGVLAGVTAVVDAGSSGSMTVDELFEMAEGCRTDVYAVVYLDQRGIADTGTIPTSPGEIPPIPLGELAAAIERHGDRILGVKTGVYADLGPAWAKVAIAAAEALGQRLYVHVGNFPTHRAEDVDVMRSLFAGLRPGDVVTHCYTGQAGGLLDEHGEPLPEALDAAARGVAFDLGHSGGGFDVVVARRLLAAGLRPDMVSSDVSVINVRRRVRNLAHVMGKVWALGIPLEEVVSMVTDGPHRVFGLPSGGLEEGQRGDLTVFDVTEGPARFEDTTGTAFEGPGELRVRATVKAGSVVMAEPDAVLRPANLRSRPLDAPGAPEGLDPASAVVLEHLSECVLLLPADGAVLQAAVAEAGRAAQLSAFATARAVRRCFSDRDTGNQVGWLLAEESVRIGRDGVAARLAATAEAVRDGMPRGSRAQVEALR